MEESKSSEITGTVDNWEEPYEAWKDMPQEAIDYLKGLPEFNAKIFKRVTGIDVNKEEETIEIDGKKVSKSTVKEALKKFMEEL